MKSYYKKNIEDNAYAVLYNLFHQLSIPFTPTYLVNELKNHPTYPSLQALQAVLNEYQVDNLAVQIGIEQISALELPAIAHLHTQGGYFVLLQTIDNQAVTYLDPAKGEVQMSISEFAPQWSGVVLMAVAKEQSGEPNYSQNQRLERDKKAYNYLIISNLTILFLLVLTSAATWQVFGFLLSSCWGLGLSSLLLLSQLGKAPDLVQQVCHLTRRTNCEAVLQSSASKLFSWLSWAEVGFLYFVGVILSIFLANLSTNPSPILSILAILSALVLPYTAFSVYYQALVVRVWCPLCVLVQVVLWLNFGLLFSFLPFNYLHLFDYQSFTILGFSFSLPILGWFGYKPTLAQAQKLPFIEKKLSHFQRNSELFNAWLTVSSPLEREFCQLTTDIVLGNTNAPMNILLVSNPLCAPCEVAHQQLIQFQKQYPDELKITVRFLLDSQANTPKNQIIRHFLSLANLVDYSEALSDWYAQRNYTQWAKKYPVNQFIDYEGLIPVIDWAKQHNIAATPTIYLAGKELRNPYTVADLKYHLNSLIETNLIPTNEEI
jgi:uncharacterized membrane protein